MSETVADFLFYSEEVFKTLDFNKLGRDVMYVIFYY